MRGYFTAPEAADRLGINVRTLYRWLKAGKIDAAWRSPGMHWHVSEAWVEECLRSGIPLEGEGKSKAKGC